MHGGGGVGVAQVRGKKEVMFTFLRLLIISHAASPRRQHGCVKAKDRKGDKTVSFFLNSTHSIDCSLFLYLAPKTNGVASQLQKPPEGSPTAMWWQNRVI